VRVEQNTQPSQRQPQRRETRSVIESLLRDLLGGGGNNRQQPRELTPAER
jgi:hypothetical protein